MTTQAIDVATIAHAILKLERSGIGRTGWTPVNEMQKKLLKWYDLHRDEVAELKDIVAKASTVPDVLNKFLTDNNFKPTFDEKMDGVGVVSILDMLVQWAATCTVGEITAFEPNGWKRYPSFIVPANGVEVYKMSRTEDPVVSILTKSGDRLWLMSGPDPVLQIAMFNRASAVMRSQKAVHPKWTAGVEVPMLDFAVEPSLDWLRGMSANNSDWYIDDAQQQFNLRADETGARVKVATSMAVMRGINTAPKPLVFDKPFYGWFTQRDSSIPLACFWSDTDSWQKPESSLEEL